MSTTTVTQQDYEIREVTTSFGEGRYGPMIEGVVDGRTVALAFETPPDGSGNSVWLRALLASVEQPWPAAVKDEYHARQWVLQAAAAHAKSVALKSFLGILR